MNKNLVIILISIVCFGIQLISCNNTKNNSKTVSANSILDERDNFTYKTGKIGSTTWMLNNLKYASSNSLKGDSLSAGDYYLKKNLDNICPDGWRLPYYKDISELVENMNGRSVIERGAKVVSKIELQKFNAEMDGYAFSSSKDKSISIRGRHMGIWNTTADTIFKSQDTFGNDIFTHYKIGLHIYPKTREKDSFFIEPTYSKVAPNISRHDTIYYSCRCVRKLNKG